MICVSVGEKSWERTRFMIADYNFAEVRLDYLDEISSEIIDHIFSGGEKLIATFRKRNDTEDEKRLDYLLKAIKVGAAYVDADINDPPWFISAVRDASKSSASALIISYHNYEETPELKVLDEIIDNATVYNPDIIKVACRTETASDVERILSLASCFGNIVIAGMGGMGERVRVLSSSLGSLFTYASPDKGLPTAEGQISYSRLKEKQERLADEW